MIKIPQKVSTIINFGLGLIFIFYLFRSVETYYSSLAQYGTGDQTQFSLPRIQKFLANPDSVNLNECTHLSYLIVGLPGKLVENYLNKHYKIQDKLFGNIQYTDILVFSFFQVSFCLILLFYCIFLMGFLLNLNIKKDFLIYLLIAIILLNFPTLKGLIKILKYDALSVVCTIVAVLNYILYLKNSKRKFLISSSIFSALAFIEKDTSISSILLIIVIEIINLALKPGKGKELVKNIFIFLIIYTGVFVVTTYALIPELWHIPSNTKILFKGLNDYFQVLSTGMIFFGLIIGYLAIRIIRFFKFKNKKTVHQHGKYSSKKFKQANPTRIINSNKTKLLKVEYYYITLFFSLIILFSGIIYQKNNVYDMSTINSQYFNRIKSEHLFVSKPMAQVSICTLDKSEWITRIKVLYNSIRIFIYVTPEILILIFFFSPLLLLFLHKKGFFQDDIGLLILFLFSTMLIVSYAYLLAPIEPKYNILSYLLFILYSIFLLINVIRFLLPKYQNLIILGVGLLMIRPSFLADPAYFGYKNYFRSIEVENTEFLDLNKYNWWMWLGWGETSFPIFKYIDKTTTGQQKILIDYTPPFAENNRFTILYNPYFRQTYTDTVSRNYLNFNFDEFRGFVNYYKKEHTDFIIVSKNVANRGVIGNFIIKNFRDKAVFVDKIGGVEYGWLFKIDDLVKIANNN